MRCSWPLHLPRTSEPNPPPPLGVKACEDSDLGSSLRISAGLAVFCVIWGCSRRVSLRFLYIALLMLNHAMWFWAGLGWSHCARGAMCVCVWRGASRGSPWSEKCVCVCVCVCAPVFWLVSAGPAVLGVVLCGFLLVCSGLAAFVWLCVVLGLSRLVAPRLM